MGNALKIYNSISGEKEIFKPIKEGYVGMYVCGPTVYSYIHLGNLRTFMSFDLVYRYLMHLGFKVRYVRNITDVGHLENDADEGEDKISKKARLEQLEPMEVVQKYTNDFHEVLYVFNNIPPSIEPSATGHILEQIELVKVLLEKEAAYEVNGSVYFDVVKYNENNNYGELSKRKIEDLLSNSRALEGQSEKKNPQDFALWKKASPEHIMRWPSPWGEGFPGWHLECTVMSDKYLGEQFDIHGGGLDLKFPHHECEIAQGKAVHGKSPVNYWMHANMLTLNGQKMSKSTGNSILPKDLFNGENGFFDKAIAPAVLRFFMLQAHYRSVLDLSNEALMASEKGFHRLMDAVKAVKGLIFSSTSTWSVSDWASSCSSAMDDDFNSPILISHLFEAVKVINQIKEGKASLTEPDLLLLQEKMQVFVEDILGLESQESTSGSTEKMDAAMQVLIDLRKEARSNKDFSLSDKIRDELAGKGIQLKDGREGTTYSLD